MDKSLGTLAVEAYIAGFPAEIQGLLATLREAIRAVAPEATECISYQMPTFTQHKHLVSYAAFKQHIGFYPTSSGIAAFAEALGPYVHSKGAVQFPFSEPLPLDLVQRITAFRLEEDRAAFAQKQRR